MLDNVDVTRQIRSSEVESFVSEVSAVPVVREYMHRQQRSFALDFDIVAEGRDLGTYVFPDADIKIFLVADLDVADDAIEIDTTNLTFEEQVEKIYNICRKKLG